VVRAGLVKSEGLAWLRETGRSSMADMDALFKSRNKKKQDKRKAGRSKAFTNFNAVLDDQRREEAASEAFGGESSYMGFGGDDSVEVDRENLDSMDSRPEGSESKRPGSLTAAVNASKGPSASKAGKGVIQADVRELVQGEWVDDGEGDTENSTGGSFLPAHAKKEVADLDGLSSSKPQPTKSAQILMAEEESKKLFHWTRKQALQEADPALAEAKREQEKLKEKEEEKPRVYRPRAVIEARSKQEGLHALKELDNESVFPSLGGAAKPVSMIPRDSAWGTVKEEIIRDLAIKQTEGEYLGKDFIQADAFEGQKLGYAFKLGPGGLGYYWECKPVQQQAEGARNTEEEEENATENEQAQRVEQEDEEPNFVPEKEQNVEKKEQEITPEELAAQEEKERKRREKKKQKEKEKAEWERQVALDKKREEERQKAAATSNSVPVTAPAASASTDSSALAAPPPPEARFSGLKKKKKKKPKSGPTEEEA